MTVHLRSFNNAWYNPGRTMLWRALWMFLGQPVFRSTWFASSRARAALLRMFGARVGKRAVIRQGVIVKYPWCLVVGSDCWIGEQVWIDNLTMVVLGSDVCVSQGAYLCTGNHDWTDPAFGLRVAGIELRDGSWAGAKSVFMPGVTLGAGAIAAAGSVVTTSVAEDTIVMGNPAAFVKKRVLRQSALQADGNFIPAQRTRELQEELG